MLMNTSNTCLILEDDTSFIVDHFSTFVESIRKSGIQMPDCIVSLLYYFVMIAQGVTLLT